MGLIEPALALFVSFCALGVMLYKRVNLGITLNLTALLLAVLALDWQNIPAVIHQTTIDLLTIATVLATFGIMLLSQLYKETKVINDLSESASKLINNPKIVSSLLPAIIGFLPVAGGALMSAPLVDSEAEKLGLKSQKKAYINLWFRHTVFPVYPLSQVLIITAALTGIAVPLIIIRQIPVVIVMIITGGIISFWKTSAKKEREATQRKSSMKRFLVAFSPILATIVVVAILDVTGFGLAKLGFDVFIATFVGLIVLLLITQPGARLIAKTLKGREIYIIPLAAYGAFLLRSVTIATGVPELFKTFAVNGSIDFVVLLTVVPAVLGFITGSPSGGVAISVSILAGMLVFSPKTASLLYMSAYLGYLIVPSHLCFAFTVDYFKCSMGRVYKYVIPSFLITFAAALIVYFVV